MGREGLIEYVEDPGKFFVPEERMGDAIGRYINKNLDRIVKTLAGLYVFVFKRPDMDIEEDPYACRKSVLELIDQYRGKGVLYNGLVIPSGPKSGMLDMSVNQCYDSCRRRLVLLD